MPLYLMAQNRYILAIRQNRRVIASRRANVLQGCLAIGLLLSAGGGRRFMELLFLRLPKQNRRASVIGADMHLRKQHGGFLRIYPRQGCGANDHAFFIDSINRAIRAALKLRI